MDYTTIAITALMALIFVGFLVNGIIYDVEKEPDISNFMGRLAFLLLGYLFCIISFLPTISQCISHSSQPNPPAKPAHSTSAPSPSASPPPSSQVPPPVPSSSSSE